MTVRTPVRGCSGRSQTLCGPPSITRSAGWLVASGTLYATTGWARPLRASAPICSVATLKCDVHALAKQNLAVLGFGAEPGRNIAHGADRGVARAVGEPDLAQRRIAL